MLTIEKKTELYNCIIRQFPDEGLYKVSRICEWLHTNGYFLENLGFSSFRDFALALPEIFEFQDDDNDEFITIKKWITNTNEKYSHPADGFFGSDDLILNDDIIEMTQKSLYALTKILDNGFTVQQMKQEIYDKFDEAKRNTKLNFFGEKYVFPIGQCRDGLLVNGIVTKNLSAFGKSLYFSFEKTQIYCPVVQTQAKVVHGSVSEEEKDRIYNVLTSSFPCNHPLHMASVSKFLSDRGIDRMKYGYYKMKDFLGDLGFLHLDEVVLGGVPQVMVIIEQRETTFRHRPVYSRPAVEHKENENIPEGTLSDFCNLPIKPVSILAKFLEDGGRFVDVETVENELNEDFFKARTEGSVKVYDSKIVFPSRYLKEDKSKVEITLKHSAYEGKKWFLYFVDLNVHEKGKGNISPGKQLENFAFLGSWSSFLSELADKAVEEEWDFRNSTRKNYQILIQYIKYTFSRLVREKKVCISFDKQFAAFNTGLADDHYDDIYACFVPNDPVSDTEWKFSGFCTAASGGLGKQLVNYFNPLPAPPVYFTRNEDLFFDHTKQLHTDFEHIIVDNIKRLPLQFLYDQFFDFPEARDIVEKIRTVEHDRHYRDELYERLREIVLANSRLFVRIQNRIKDSIELAKKRVRWNYKTAIPSYFPKRDSMSLMLPLALLDEIKPDVALVVELTRSGSYQGQTILTLPQAYIDARLMCRLTGDWLVPSEIFDTGFDDSEMIPVYDEPGVD